MSEENKDENVDNDNDDTKNQDTGVSNEDDVDTGSGSKGKSDSDADGDADDESKSGDTSNSDDPEKKKLLKEAMKRKERIKALETEQAEAKKTIDAFKDALGDTDLDELKTILSANKERETKELEAKGQWDALKKQMADDHKAKTAKLEETITELQTTNKKLTGQLEDLTVGQQFSNSNFINEELVIKPAKARIIYGEHFDIVNGEVVAYDKPRGAENRTELVDASGDNLNFDDALQKIIDGDPDKDTLIKSKKRQGSSSNSDSSASAKTKDTSDTNYGISRIAAAARATKK